MTVVLCHEQRLVTRANLRGEHIESGILGLSRIGSCSQANSIFYLKVQRVAKVWMVTFLSEWRERSVDRRAS